MNGGRGEKILTQRPTAAASTRHRHRPGCKATAGSYALPLGQDDPFPWVLVLMLQLSF